MNEKADVSHAVVNQFEALITALKKERDGLERRLVLLRSHQNFLDDASKLYFDLVRLKREARLEILELSPIQREHLDNLLGPDVVDQQLQEIGDRLYGLIKKGSYVTFAEIEGILKVIDGIIEMLQKQKGQIAKEGQSALQTVKKLTSKVIRLCGGLALIGLDLPIQNWVSVVGGAILISTTSLGDSS